MYDTCRLEACSRLGKPFYGSTLIVLCTHVESEGASRKVAGRRLRWYNPPSSCISSSHALALDEQIWRWHQKLHSVVHGLERSFRRVLYWCFSPSSSCRNTKTTSRYLVYKAPLPSPTVRLLNTRRGQRQRRLLLLCKRRTRRPQIGSPTSYLTGKLSST